MPYRPMANSDLGTCNEKNYEGASIPTIHIKKDADATDGLKLIFGNCFLLGIQKSTPVKIKGFTEIIDQKHQIDFKLSRANLLADYQMEGTVLGQKIKCNGRANITYVNPSYNVMIEGERSMKGNVVYLSPKKIMSQLSLSNLFTSSSIVLSSWKRPSNLKLTNSGEACNFMSLIWAKVCPDLTRGCKSKPKRKVMLSARQKK
uniref:Uncharacterized protein n=1 Tax=Glossina austeni TaxID=7395 RepID=A0A1A9UNI5_GLOAU